MKKVIYISGVDGAGKTTISRKLFKHYTNQNLKVKYTWATLRPVIFKPIIIVAKFIFVRKYNKYEDYSIHKKHKQKAISRFKILISIQFFIAIFDYYPQYLFKVYLPSKFNNIIFADRYYIDFFIERGMLAGWSPKATLSKILLYEKLFIKPNKSIYLKITSDGAIKRKNDIPSIEYLNDRMKYYDYIHSKLNSHIIDAKNSPEEILKEVKNII